MKPSNKRAPGKLLNLPDALEASVRAGDLWSLFHAVNMQPRTAWPSHGLAAAQRPALRLAARVK
jgi:hypothetical protein